MVPLHAGKDSEHCWSDDNNKVFHSSVAKDIIDGSLETVHLQAFLCHSHSPIDGAFADEVHLITHVGVIEHSREVVVSEPSRHRRCCPRLFVSLLVSYRACLSVMRLSAPAIWLCCNAAVSWRSPSKCPSSAFMYFGEMLVFCGGAVGCVAN